MDSMKERIARRAARELKDGDVVNLGIGLPTMVADYIPKDIEIKLQSENGLLGMGGTPLKEEVNLDVQNAGATFIKANPGAMFFDSAESFCMIRGGHIDVTILGAFQVDEMGNLANWMVPDGKISGMGGAMDLSIGSRKLIITMKHSSDMGPKILKKCTYPLTAINSVNMIITEMGVFKVAPQTGLVLTEIFKDITLNEIAENTVADFQVAKNLITIDD